MPSSTISAISTVSSSVTRRPATKEDCYRYNLTNEDTSTGYTQEEVDNNGWTKATRDITEYVASSSETVDTPVTKYITSAESDTVNVVCNGETPMTLSFTNNSITMNEDTGLSTEQNTGKDSDIIFKARGYAYRDFEISPNSTYNVEKEAVFSDLQTRSHSTHLFIEAGAEAHTGIDMEWQGLSNAKLGISTMDTITWPRASEAINQVKNAQKKVNEVRSNFGSYVNRMEHAMRFNALSVENQTAADSRIRDTDVATEMVEFSTHNIIEQAGTSMLTQANQSTQNILSLLG